MSGLHARALTHVLASLRLTTDAVSRDPFEVPVFESGLTRPCFCTGVRAQAKLCYAHDGNVMRDAVG